MTSKLDERRIGKIGSSRAAAILGLSSYTTPLQVFEEIQHERKTGERPPSNNTRATERGNVLEDVVIAYGAKRLGASITQAEWRQHPKADCFGDSVDATYTHDTVGGLVEAKTVSGAVAHKWGRELTDEIPTEYLIQCQWHLAHWPEYSICWVPVLIGGYEFEFRLYRVDRDDELIKKILNACKRFWIENVKANLPPTATALDEEWLKKRFPTVIGEKKTAKECEDEKVIALARQYKSLSEQITPLEEEKKKVKAELMQIVGEGYGLKGAWGSVTWGEQEGSPNIKAYLLGENIIPDEEILKKYTSKHRVLRVNYRGVK